MVKKTKYSKWIGVKKAIKNNAITLVPFVLAVLASVPPEYAWIASVVVYMLKNYYEVNK